MHEISIATADFNRLGVINDIHGGLHSFTTVMDQVHGVILDLEKENTFTNLSEMIKNLKVASGNIDIITDDIATGKGTIGKLVKNDDMYLRMNAIFSKMDTLMNDVNHYGILFHLNKSWQRERLQKVTLLNSLDTPTAFRNYFEKEVDDVNMAMSRLSLLIQKAGSSKEQQNILKNDHFKEDFAQLLRDVDELANNLKLYNEQLNFAQPQSQGK